MKTFNIADYGAFTSDRLMTKPIQTAIDDCFLSGGGEVVIPEGYFRTGSLRLRSHVTLHLMSGAILEGSEYPEDYFNWRDDTVEPLNFPPDPYNTPMRRSSTPYSAWSNGLIRIINAEDVTIIGEPNSYIDGRNVYDPRGEENFRGPHGISAWDVKGLTLRGYTIRNTGNWAQALFRCEDVTVTNVTAYGGHDALDLFLCRHVNVENCRFYTGDDCLAGFGSVDVSMQHCTLNTACSIIRFGGTHVHISDCECVGPARFGHRCTLSQEEKAGSKMPSGSARRNTKTAFLYYCDNRFGTLPERPGDIVIENCRFLNVDQLFNMDFGRHVWCCNAPLSSITFKNCTLTGMELPVYIHGGAEDPLSFTLENCCISPAEGKEDIPFADIESYCAFSLDKVELTGFADPSVLDRGDGQIRTTDSTALDIKKAAPGGSTLSGH